jgi:hypothetical protein
MFAGIGAWFAAISIWSWIKFTLFAALMVFVGTLAWTYIHDYRNLAEENVRLKYELTKYDGRLTSYSRMIARRDAAISASQCKAKIEYWVRNPESIPVPFDPFKTSPLAPPNPQGQPNRVDTDPVPEWKAPDLSKLLPWNWF